ncbi:MAG: hypothetical protein LBI26_01010 [Holosporales bacterium]|jgi:outer membrane murein-binding lipoprotein Lpp|nr:hypothetical protein [Holosporales bacterium]
MIYKAVLLSLCVFCNSAYCSTEQKLAELSSKMVTLEFEMATLKSELNQLIDKYKNDPSNIESSEETKASEIDTKVKRLDGLESEIKKINEEIEALKKGEAEIAPQQSEAIVYTETIPPESKNKEIGELNTEKQQQTNIEKIVKTLVSLVKEDIKKEENTPVSQKSNESVKSKDNNVVSTQPVKNDLKEKKSDNKDVTNENESSDTIFVNEGTQEANELQEDDENFSE